MIREPLIDRHASGDRDLQVGSSQSAPRERAILFGRDRSLVGVVALGEAGKRASGYPRVIMLNAGLLHRVGPHRMYVDVARRLALEGVTSLRMDFSGIGDSGPRADGLPASESVISEAQEAMDVLARTPGSEGFVMMGLCSGADNGFRIACADSRVTGLVLIDPFPYRTPGYWLRHYGRRLGSIRSWRNVLARRHWIWGRFRRAGSEPEAERFPERELPPRERVEQELRALVARDVKILVIYTAGLAGSYNYREQFLRTFHRVDFGNCLQLEYFASSDHTFTLLEDRKRLVELIAAWTLRVA